MKKLLTIFFVTIFCGTLYAPEGRAVFSICESQRMEPYQALWEAVCMVESGMYDKAYNKHEKAYGVAQIRQIRLNDYAQRTGIRYTLTDCYDKEISKTIFMYYCNGDYESVAKSWNGSGRKTIAYWNKVSYQLNKLKMTQHNKL